MDAIELPKPTFDTSDETSITITSTFPTVSIVTSALEEGRIRLQFKQPHESWEAAKNAVMAVSSGKGAANTTNVQAVLSSVCVEDLNPGTPYSVRFVIVDSETNIIKLGPETVYDTAPVDCGPKKKSCVIC